MGDKCVEELFQAIQIGGVEGGAHGVETTKEIIQVFEEHRGNGILAIHCPAPL